MSGSLKELNKEKIFKFHEVNVVRPATLLATPLRFIFILKPISDHELALLLNLLVINWSKCDFKLKIVQFFIWYLRKYLSTFGEIKSKL